MSQKIRIEDIDKNFSLNGVNKTDVEWFEFSDERFSLHGVYYDEGEGLFRRMPRKISETVNGGVDYLVMNTAGGRLRFSTDSPYVTIKCVEPVGGMMPHMPFSGSHGFALFEGVRFIKGYIPSIEQLTKDTNGETMRIKAAS
ncbi:MAG: hypothetical protein IIX01_00485, partial [Clostridia bacterium]|nr:hypothetical protein [Clostridia bacterium]